MKKTIILVAILASHLGRSCGIVGYVGNNVCQSFIVQGLARMQHLGHDSAGLACIDKDLKALVCIKAVGYVDALKNKLQKDPHDGHIGIGHIRRASHGKPNEINAHPHLSNDGIIALVHNGLITNYRQLKEALMQKGYEFKSETDTEVIVHLFADRYSALQSLFEATIDVVNTLRGTCTSVLMLKDHPDTLVVIRKGLPIYIGIGRGEMFVASLTLALRGNVDRIVSLPDQSFALIKKDVVEIYNFKGRPLIIKPNVIGMKRSFYDTVEYAQCVLRNIVKKRMQSFD